MVRHTTGARTKREVSNWTKHFLKLCDCVSVQKFHTWWTIKTEGYDENMQLKLPKHTIGTAYGPNLTTHGTSGCKSKSLLLVCGLLANKVLCENLWDIKSFFMKASYNIQIHINEML